MKDSELAHLTPPERAAATVYTSGEHCPMCAAAHAWVGPGRIVYVASSQQLTARLAESGVLATGPVPELAGEVRELRRRFHTR